MHLTAKELEQFIWQQPAACSERGLHIAWRLFALGRRYAHLRLGPYGVAQQVNVCFEPRLNCYFVQVIVITAGVVTCDAYSKAQQQLSAMQYLLHTAGYSTEHSAERQAGFHGNCVLIGRKVELQGALATALVDNRYSCLAYTVDYDVNGIRFKRVKTPNYLLPTEVAELDWLTTDLLAEREDAFSISKANREYELACLATPSPDVDAVLVVTSDGVLMPRGATGEGEMGDA